MKASKILLAAFVLVGLALATGCEKKKSKDPAPEDIAGTWSGILKNDESGESSSAQFTLTQTEAAVGMDIEFNDPSLFGGLAGWSTHLGVYSVADGHLSAFKGKDQLNLIFSGNKAEGTFVSQTVGSFTVNLTKLQAQ